MGNNIKNYSNYSEREEELRDIMESSGENLAGGNGDNNGNNDDDGDSEPIDTSNMNVFGQGAHQEKSTSPLLDAIGRDFTKMAEEGKIDPIIGRQKEIEQVIWVLSRKNKNNPIIIGEPGVGKTAIVEGIARMIASDDCPEALEGKRIVGIDMGTIMAGTSAQGDLEAKMKQLMKELTVNDDIILFIDEVHMIVNSNLSIDVGNMMKPALARGEIRLIGATTYNEFRTSIEKDGALNRRFQKVNVEPTSVEDTLKILQAIQKNYEEYHNVEYSDDAIKACVSLSDKYITDRVFPDKAVDLMDEVGARIRVTRKKNVPPEIIEVETELHRVREEKDKFIKSEDYEASARSRKREKELLDELSKLGQKYSNEEVSEVNKEDVENVISLKTGIPLNRISKDETERLLNLEKDLSVEIIGQDEAVSKVSKCIRRSRAGLKDPNRPNGVFLFLGSTGVGKCHGKGTKILMYDGSVKNVEDINEGEFLMGDDSTPRKVLSLARGRDKMYKIKSKNSEPYVCNEQHVLSLKKTGSHEIVNIPLNEYLKSNKTFKHTHKSWKTGVEFKDQSVKIDPYLIGLWLGDGDKDRTGITTADSEIVNYLYRVSDDYNLNINVQEQANNESNRYYISGDNHKDNNTLLHEFREYGLIDKSTNHMKFIPQEYLINSTENRKKLLAGLIDSDGYVYNKCYEISSKHEKLAEDIVFLCRSLGYKSWVVDKVINGVTYYMININGDLSDIPFLLERKKSEPRLQKKNVNLSSFEVEYIGEDDYYGFELDGNHLYLLGDFTVTHNTHTVKTLAKHLFNSSNDVIRIDMSEYRGEHNVSRLIGAPPGYVGYGEGGQLTEKVRRKPYSIVLFDEIEKAHPKVLDVLLQVFDDGHLTDGEGRKVDFKNTIIIMTSNIGTSAIDNMIEPVGFGTSASPKKDANVKEIISKELKRELRPEFINRIDDIIIFNSLEKEAIMKIVDNELNKLGKRMEELGYELEVTDSVKEFLMEQGYDEKMGARPLKRAIQKYLEDPIADQIIRKKIEDKVEIDYDSSQKKLIVNGDMINEKIITNFDDYKLLEEKN